MKNTQYQIKLVSRAWSTPVSSSPRAPACSPWAARRRGRDRRLSSWAHHIGCMVYERAVVSSAAFVVVSAMLASSSPLFSFLPRRRRDGRVFASCHAWGCFLPPWSSTSAFIYRRGEIKIPQPKLYTRLGDLLSFFSRDVSCKMFACLLGASKPLLSKYSIRFHA